LIYSPHLLLMNGVCGERVGDYNFTLKYQETGCKYGKTEKNNQD